MASDYGTPELIQHKQAQKLRRTGLEALYGQRTIDADQYNAGRVYAATFQAMYSQFNPRSCLGDLCHIPDHEPHKASERWVALLANADAKSLHGRLSGKLARKSFYARGKHLHTIVERIAGHDDWGLKDVAEACGVAEDTARAYTRQAFDALIDCIAEIEAENKDVARAKGY